MDKSKASHDSIKLYTELREKYMQTRERWFQSLLMSGAGLLGALVALTDNSQESLGIRRLFVLTITLLLLGILSAAGALLYNMVHASRAKRAAQKYISHTIDSRNKRLYISIDDPKGLLYFDGLSYIFFSLSFISLVLYVIAKNLPEVFC